MTEYKPHAAPDFAAFVTDLHYGEINQKLTDRLAEVVRAVENTGRSGELTVKFSVKKEGEMAIIGVDIKAKAPEHPLHGTLFYMGGNGELLREDPRQLTLKNLDKPPMKTVAFPIADDIPFDAGDDNEQ